MRRTLLAAVCALFLLCPAQGRNSSFLQRRVSDWLNDLNRADKPAKRGAAAFALGRMGADAVLAVPDLAKKASTDPDAGVRDMAAAALGEIIHDMKEEAAAFRWRDAESSLLVALGDDDPRVRRSAAYALGAFGKSSASCGTALRERLLKDKSPSVRQNAAWALGRQKQADNDTVAALCDVLGDPDALVRRDAAAALENLGQDYSGDRKAIRTAAKPLLDLAKNEKDEVVRKTALGALASLAGPEHREYAPDLYHLLDGKDEETARGAAYALGNMGGEPARRALPVLKKALTCADPLVQALAAATLANAGEDAADAVDDLARTLTSSKNPIVRVNCCVAIGHLKEHGKPAISALAETIKAAPRKDEPSEQVREKAAEAIAQIRFPNNEGAMEAVRTAIMKDTNQTVRQYCVWATFNVPLEKYDLVKPLTDVLDEKGDRVQDGLLVRYDAARCLAAALSEKAPDKAIDVLLHMLENKFLKVFNKTDANIKNAPKEGGGGNTAIADDLGGDARYMAATALGWMKGKLRDNQKVKDALTKATEDKDVKLREAAKKALKEIQ